MAVIGPGDEPIVAAAEVGRLLAERGAVLVCGGGYGTLSEVALALKAGKRVIGLGSWEIEGVTAAEGPDAAVAAALA